MYLMYLSGMKKAETRGTSAAEADHKKPSHESFTPAVWYHKEGVSHYKKLKDAVVRFINKHAAGWKYNSCSPVFLQESASTADGWFLRHETSRVRATECKNRENEFLQMISAPSVPIPWCPELRVEVKIGSGQKQDSQTLLLLFTVNGQKAQVGEGSVHFSLGDRILALRGTPLPVEHRSQTI